MEKVPVNDEEQVLHNPKGKEIDISDEEYRNYRFPKGESTVIHNPKTLIVADDGHVVIDKGGYKHQIPFGFIHIKTKKHGEAKTQTFTQKRIITEKSGNQ